MKINHIVVLGAGSAGLMAALTLKRKIPRLEVEVVRSPEIGVIGVGEGTTVVFPRHFFEYLKMKPGNFYREAEPTWKMGIRFLWGPREKFFYTFSFEFERRLPELSRNNGFYYSEEFPWLGNASAYMAQGKVFPRRPDGLPQFHNNHAFHVENKKLVAWLENRCRESAITIVDATIKPELGGEGIAALVTETGQRITADLFIDASGFRSELLGRALAEVYRSYEDSLFCDRAVIGGWTRTNEPILPYTTAETMDAGWCWQIEHENFINRGYVYSSRFISDEAALNEFLGKNPKVSTPPRSVKFRSGRYERNWVGNVVAMGNSAGFVEPLEATALQVICVEASTLADALSDSLCEPNPSMIKLYNRYNADQWDDIRNFLAIHYKFNTRLNTPFWEACRQETALHRADEIVEFYRENGPSVLAGVTLVHPSNSFKMDGFLALLVGQNVPHHKPYDPSPDEKAFWRQHCLRLQDEARRGMDVKETLAAIRSPDVKLA
ncbi:MAG TPA: tryptophan 7-halogenase [Verrucomicrobiae bacterium]|jgi:tryptophan halogenase|nr:tryptophan 7-halogenase [Verrucomicrobiae bacterium]